MLSAQSSAVRPPPVIMRGVTAGLRPTASEAPGAVQLVSIHPSSDSGSPRGDSSQSTRPDSTDDRGATSRSRTCRAPSMIPILPLASR